MCQLTWGFRGLLNSSLVSRLPKFPSWLLASILICKKSSPLIMTASQHSPPKQELLMESQNKKTTHQGAAREDYDFGTCTLMKECTRVCLHCLYSVGVLPVNMHTIVLVNTVSCNSWFRFQVQRSLSSTKIVWIICSCAKFLEWILNM